MASTSSSIHSSSVGPASAVSGTAGKATHLRDCLCLYDNELAPLLQGFRLAFGRSGAVESNNCNSEFTLNRPIHDSPLQDVTDRRLHTGYCLLILPT